MSKALDVYPIYLRRLNERKTVIVGGDWEAEGKIKDFLDRGAWLTVISPELNEPLQEWADEGHFEWIPRQYKYGDFEGASVAIVAEFEGDINKIAYKEAKQRNILINVMDDLPHANFAFGSIVKQGPLTISISTGGAAPALAVRLRQRFEKEFGKEYGEFLEFMQSLRKPMKKHIDEFDTRKKLWYELIDSEILTLFSERKVGQAYQRAKEILGDELVDDAMGVETAD